jgi:hypothetical protein
MDDVPGTVRHVFKYDNHHNANNYHNFNLNSNRNHHYHPSTL